MTETSPIRRLDRPDEEGYILVAVIFMLAILIISLAVAVPKVREDIQRDREIETMHRGQQYVRAIQLYYRKFGTYPPNIDALVKTNEIRFLRKKYIDPTTGKDEWKPIPVGQNKTPVMGFFGQPLAGTGSPAAGVGAAGVGGTSTIGSPFESSDNSGSGSTIQSNSPSTTSGSGFGTSPGIGTTPPTSGIGGSTIGTTDGGSSSSAFGSTGAGGQTFGGAGIMGVSPASPKQSILVYKKKNHYNEWEFFYSPLADRMMSGGNAGIIGQPAGSNTGGIGGTQPGTGFGINLGGTPPNPPASPPPSPSPSPSPAPQQ